MFRHSSTKLFFKKSACSQQTNINHPESVFEIFPYSVYLGRYFTFFIRGSFKELLGKLKNLFRFFIYLVKKVVLHPMAPLVL